MKAWLCSLGQTKLNLHGINKKSFFSFLTIPPFLSSCSKYQVFSEPFFLTGALSDFCKFGILWPCILRPCLDYLKITFRFKFLCSELEKGWDWNAALWCNSQIAQSSSFLTNLRIFEPCYPQAKQLGIFYLSQHNKNTDALP